MCGIWEEVTAMFDRLEYHWKLISLLFFHITLLLVVEWGLLEPYNVLLVGINAFVLAFVSLPLVISKNFSFFAIKRS